MRVLIVAGSFHPEIGGPPRYLNALGRELVAQGHEVTVVCMSPPGKVEETYPFRVVRISRGWPVPLRLSLMLLAILRRGWRADLLFISDYGVPPVLANKLLRKPALIKIVGDFAWEYARRHALTDEDFDSFQKTEHSGKLARLQRLQRFYVGACDHVLVPSGYLKEIVTGWGIDPGRITVIHNAVAQPEGELPEDRVAARAGLGLPRRYVLTIARLAPWKGIDHLIDCVPDLPADVDLVVVGEGPERDKLEARAQERGVAERVRFTGAVPFKEVALYLRGAELLALYTGYEGLSHVLLEALVVGTPIVASAKGGNVEVVDEERSGLLVPYGDEAALAAALRRVLDDPQLRDRLAAGSLAKSEEFSWPRLVDRTLELMERVRSRADSSQPNG